MGTNVLSVTKDVRAKSGVAVIDRDFVRRMMVVLPAINVLAIACWVILDFGCHKPERCGEGRAALERTASTMWSAEPKSRSQSPWVLMGTPLITRMWRARIAR